MGSFFLFLVLIFSPEACFISSSHLVCPSNIRHVVSQNTRFCLLEQFNEVIRRGLRALMFLRALCAFIFLRVLRAFILFMPYVPSFLLAYILFMYMLTKLTNQ